MKKNTMAEFKEISAVVLAGGRGERMKELSNEKPKPLLEVEGKAILAHIFDNIVEAFGSAEVIVAVGYRGEDIKKMFGDRYRNVSIKYVHDPRRLETKNRLLSLGEHINTSFLFLAGDVICDPEQLVKVVELQEKEKREVFGTISGAEDHFPALTHAIIKIVQNRAVEMVFPPTEQWLEDDLREMNVACYTPNFLGLLKDSPKDVINISRVISDALKQGRIFQVSKYCKPWYHFANPEDLKVQLSSRR